MNPQDLSRLQAIDLSQFYWIIGALVVMNVGSIGSMVVAAVRMVWFISKLDSRIEGNRKDINNAHQKIRTIETKVYEI
jgi:hypothetical protein